MDTPSTRRTGTAFVVVVSIVGSTPVAAPAQVTSPAITVSSVTLNPSSVAGGNGVTGTITISAPAPPSGFRVQLGSSNLQRARPASQLTIARGQTSGQFAIETYPIDQHPGTIDPDPTITISAWEAGSPRGVRRSASLTVTPAALVGIAVETPIPSGTSADATVTLNGPAPASGVTLALTSTDPSDVSMPSSVAIPPGARTAGFTITPDPEIYDRAFVIQARRSTFDTEQAQLVVRIPEPERLICPGKPTPLPEFTGGNDVSCKVRLDGRAPFDYGVNLESSDKVYGFVEKSVTVPNGQWDADIRVQTKPVTLPRPVAITGTQRGTTKSATFRLIGARLKRVAVDPDPVTGGQTVNVTVTLTGPAATSVGVTVQSSNPNIFQVLTPITIGAGQVQAATEVSTVELDDDTDVTATARLGTALVQDEFVIKHTPRPDLVVSFLSPRPTPRFYVANVGEADAPASTLWVELVSSTGEVSRTALAVPPLPNQGQVFLQLQASCWGCKLIADGPNEIKESNEANNIKVVQ
jgi:hypothetical protein